MLASVRIEVVPDRRRRRLQDPDPNGPSKDLALAFYHHLEILALPATI
jgi:hypothetical protein